MIDLNDYICGVPFNSLELHNNVYFLCCPSWLPNKINQSKFPIKDVWNSEPVVEIRKSILDGSYRYCDKEMCPHLSKLINFGVASGPIRKKTGFNFDVISKDSGPENVIMNFDRTCNYKCPSCRLDLIVENSKGIERVQKTIEEVDEYFSPSIKTIYITGTGDPFVSVGFRNYLRNFNPKKYPKLENIHLHTNASMWNKEMWDSMPNVHNLVRTCEISIDAGTKETYEQKTRIGGDWDILMSNLKFISTIPKIYRIKTSFVVQDVNYFEMETFYDLMYSIFGDKVNVFFGKITNWGTFSNEKFKIKKIWDEIHPDHSLFIDEFQKIWKKPKVTHNMYEFIKNDRTTKTLI